MQSYEKMSKLLAFERIFYAKFKLFLYIKCLFPTWRRNLSYVLTQKLLRRHVISRALGEKKNPLQPLESQGIHIIHLSICTLRIDLLKIGGRQLETVYNKAVWLHLHVQYIALSLCI